MADEKLVTRIKEVGAKQAVEEWNSAGKKIDLSGADLRTADLSAADLSGADLTKADLFKANLSGADLTGADLFKAHLSGANLSGSYLSGSYLREANLFGTKGLPSEMQERIIQMLRKSWE